MIMSAPQLPLPLSTQSSGRSLLSRIASPLSTKVRNIVEFYIVLDQPYRQYSPGDVVTGSVVLKAVKPVRVTHLVVCLHGYVQVYKNPGVPVDPVPSYSATTGSTRAKRGGGYYGNGFASLFEHEVVQCGEGRLDEGIYRFNFELEFPGSSLPSSIDFERGTVSYLVTATLTRPTTLSPTMTCERKLFLIEDINIAPLPLLRPKVISLKPIARGLKPKAGSRRMTATAHRSKPLSNISQTDLTGEGLDSDSLQDDYELPRSPVSSTLSTGSRASSSSTRDSAPDFGPASVVTGESERFLSAPSFKADAVTATVQVLQSGCLRGGSVSVKVSVNHTKIIKNVNGVIVTLFRQARLDMHPALPLASSGRGNKPKFEDYYPKSKSGLGGLSLSSAGSSHVFRKDLSQSIAPLILDPNTLSAEIKTSVRVPEEAFPTIASVPGSMISFKYYIEVVLDLYGKLAGPEKHLPTVGPVLSSGLYGAGRSTRNLEDASGAMYATLVGSFVDTENLRRDKSVVTCVFEIVVGTRDSERAKGKRKDDGVTRSAVNEVGHQDLQPVSRTSHPLHDNIEHRQVSPSYDRYHPPPEGDRLRISSPHYHQAHTPPYSVQGEEQADYFHLTLDLVSEEASLTEKERLRRQEARLLPSQPPGTESSPSGPAVNSASAPVVHEDESLDQVSYPAHGDHPPHQSQATAVSSVDSPHALPMHASEDPNTPAATYSPVDDKQEVQRQRLENDRSMPDGLTLGPVHDSTTEAEYAAPTAPVLDHIDISYNVSDSVVELPRYSR